jgi:hypothetical protein
MVFRLKKIRIKTLREPSLRPAGSIREFLPNGAGRICRHEQNPPMPSQSWTHVSRFSMFQGSSHISYVKKQCMSQAYDRSPGIFMRFAKMQFELCLNVNALAQMQICSSTEVRVG